MLNTRDIIFFQFFQNLEYLQWTNKKGKKYEIGFLRRMYNSDRKWVSKLGKFLYSLNFVHEYYNYHQVYYAVIISIDERNSVESTISKKIRKLSFEPRGWEWWLFPRRIYITINGLSRCIVPSPCPSIYIEPNRWSIRWLGKIVHTTHPWRNISRRRDGSRSARLEYKMDYPSPLSREEKRNICSGVDDLKRNLKFRNLFGNYYHYQSFYYFVFLCYLYTNYFYLLFKENNTIILSIPFIQKH